MEPLLFVPIVDALVIKNPKIADKYKANMFKVKNNIHNKPRSVIKP
jgi:hypothetical protein